MEMNAYLHRGNEAKDAYKKVHPTRTVYRAVTPYNFGPDRPLDGMPVCQDIPSLQAIGALSEQTYLDRKQRAQYGTDADLVLGRRWPADSLGWLPCEIVKAGTELSSVRLVNGAYAVTYMHNGEKHGGVTFPSFVHAFEEPIPSNNRPK